MKTFIIILLASLSTVAQIKPKKLDKVYVNVHIYMDEDNTLYCGMQEALFRLDNKQIVFSSQKVELELKVVKKGLGKYKSWLTVSNGTYYFVTALNHNDVKGLMFQPVEKDLTNRDDIATIVLTTKNLCQ